MPLPYPAHLHTAIILLLFVIRPPHLLATRICCTCAAVLPVFDDFEINQLSNVNKEYSEVIDPLWAKSASVCAACHRFKTPSTTNEGLRDTMVCPIGSCRMVRGCPLSADLSPTKPHLGSLLYCSLYFRGETYNLKNGYVHAVHEMRSIESAILLATCTPPALVHPTLAFPQR